MQDVEDMITDEMIDAGCAAVPDLYRVDVWRVLRAAMAVKMNDEGAQLVQVGPCTCSDHECGECMQPAKKVGAGRTADEGHNAELRGRPLADGPA